ncbi:MAG: hypothetical protein DRO92_04265 [Candidatus Altiarchaeales archaeon]|nr:MAG: hypothetical protein DRO92_04265 [Candidatus Altiarchaeales archaeon]
MENLVNKDLLLKGDKNQIVQELNGVRFKYKKSAYIVRARERFMNDGKLNIRIKIKELEMYLKQDIGWLRT